MEAVLITRGSRGMALFVRKAPTVHIPIYGTDSIVDVTGAGDTVVSTVALALAAGSSFEGAARLGRARRDEARHCHRQLGRAQRRRTGTARTVAIGTVARG
jgi:sugar/nucleoside kinase (ribokinase family)